MPQSRVLRICSVMLAAWWGLTSPLVPGSTAQLQEATKPAAEKPAADSPTVAGDVDKKAAVELTALKEKVRRLKEAFEATKKDFVPRLREAQISVQQATAALQRAVGPDESKLLEDELHMAQASLSSLEREMALGLRSVGHFRRPEPE